MTGDVPPSKRLSQESNTAAGLNADALSSNRRLKHQRICTREDFMSVVHVLPAAESEQAHIKFKQVRNTYLAPFVIYADFESILEPMERRVKQTLYNQQQTISAACAMLGSNVPAVPTQTWVSIGENALSEFLNTLIDWERVCIAHLKKQCPDGSAFSR